MHREIGRRVTILAFCTLVSLAHFSCKPDLSAQATNQDANAPTSAIHRAAAKGDRTAIEALLQQGAPVEGKDRHEWTPLHWAVISNKSEAVDTLLDHGADPNAKAQFDMTPLHWASMKGAEDIVPLLVRRGARTDARNLYGRTPLHDAADYKTALALMAAGAAVEAQDDFGMTPLQTARGGLVAKALFRAGADPRIANKQGLGALQMTLVESLEAQGLSIQARRAHLRVRSSEGIGAFTLRSVTERLFEDLTITASSRACQIEVVPTRLARFEPAQIADWTLKLKRIPNVPEGVYFVYFTVSEGKAEVGRFELKVDTSSMETPEDRGMISISGATVRRTPSAVYYLIYAAVPVAVGLGWILARRRSRRSNTGTGSSRFGHRA